MAGPSSERSLGVVRQHGWTLPTPILANPRWLINYLPYEYGPTPARQPPSLCWAAAVPRTPDTTTTEPGRRLAARTGLVLMVSAAAVAGLGAVVSLTSTPETVNDEATGIAFGTHAPPPLPSTTSDTARCPWLQRTMNRHTPAATLAADVVARMTVREKLGEIVLEHVGPYENINAGVPRLCIPALSLQDGPQGLAYGAVGVTQLPAPLGIAATFDTGIAQDYGQVQGSEAAGQGIDVIQGPTLNIDRVPQSGRTYEGFGEDPVLVAAMGVADAEGIQSAGTLAMAKHFAVYNQETDRGVLDASVSPRALEELYFPPFKAAVTRAHVSTVMCAYPRLNGTYQCQDPALSGQLADWGFAGFIRSDLGSVHDPVAAIEAGTDLLKPSSVAALARLVREHRLPVAAVDRAVIRVLTQMFVHGLVDRPTTGSPGTAVDTDSHTDLALVAAERSAVLLKDAGGVLPLAGSAHRSVAVIGADAGSRPVTSGYGSSRVIAPFVSSPWKPSATGPGATPPSPTPTVAAPPATSPPSPRSSWPRRRASAMASPSP